MKSVDSLDAAAHLAALLDASDDATLTTDLHGTVTSWSAGAEHLYGYSAAEVVGRSILALTSADSTDDERDLLERLERGDTIRGVDAVRRRRDGTALPVSLTVVPLRSQDGTLAGTLRVVRDTTVRPRAERAARRLAAIVHSSDDAIISKDLRGIVMSWNLAAQRMFGYTEEEMIGQSIRVLIPADRQSEEDAVLESIARGVAVEHFETIRQHKNGTFIPISLTVSPIHDDTGRIVGASKIARDISDRKQSEIERALLLAMAEQNAAITERLNQVGAIVASGLDRAAIVQAVTDAATELTGAEFGAFFYNVIDERGEAYSLYTISGVPIERFSRFPMPRNTAVFNPTFTGQGIVRSDDITQDPRYGQSAPHYGMPKGHLPVRSYLGVPVISRSGDVLGGLFFGHSAAGVFQERHERLAAGVASWAAVALENARLYASAQEASRLKDEFLATLSHELRTPLNAILGYARMLRGGIVPVERQARAIATIERNATSLTQIVEDVLDVSRIISGKLRMNMDSREIGEIVQHAIEAVTPSAIAKGIPIDAAIDGAAGPVLCDPERMQQVIWNLLSNAVKFTSPGGRIRVTLSRAGADVQLVVSDTGIGIRKEFLPFLFDRFRQADSSTTRERGGLGLGLGIARQLVEMHGGTIDAASDGPGFGATFRVRLPAMTAVPHSGTAAGPANLTPTASLTPMPDLRGVHVLVVDDDQDALNMAREIIEAAGGRVSTADSAAAALETIDTLLPDVIVSDIGMPRMDGFELIAEIRRSGNLAVRTVPAAALTAYVRSEDRARALRSGFQTHLAKPIDPAELLTAVAVLAKHPAAEMSDTRRNA